MRVHASASENNGVDTLNDHDLRIYSVGVSTGGVAEIRMIKANPKRHIIATTIDKEGAKFARQYIADSGFSPQIEVRLEDVIKLLPYKNDSFDFIYARLVLHYLPEDGLMRALSELHRILKPSGRLFVVVRSTKCPDALRNDSTFDPRTHLTTYTYTEEATGKQELQQRFFHSVESISTYITQAGFEIKYVKSYNEHLYVDFMRTIKSPELDNVIELLAAKP